MHPLITARKIYVEGGPPTARATIGDLAGGYLATAEADGDALYRAAAAAAANLGGTWYAVEPPQREKYTMTVAAPADLPTIQRAAGAAWWPVMTTQYHTDTSYTVAQVGGVIVTVRGGHPYDHALAMSALACALDLSGVWYPYQAGITPDGRREAVLWSNRSYLVYGPQVAPLEPAGPISLVPAVCYHYDHPHTSELVGEVLAINWGRAVPAERSALALARLTGRRYTVTPAGTGAYMLAPAALAVAA